MTTSVPTWRPLASYGAGQVEVLGRQVPGRDEVFIVRVNGEDVGTPFPTWPEALTEFKRVVLQRQRLEAR